MNRGDLVESVLKGLGGTKSAAEAAVSAVLAGISKGLKKDQSVQLIGFGTFSVKQRKARTGRNPQTGETIKIKASRTIGFKAGKALKESI